MQNFLRVNEVLGIWKNGKKIILYKRSFLRHIPPSPCALEDTGEGASERSRVRERSKQASVANY